MNEVPESPKPISTPAETSSSGPLVACPISTSPQAYMREPAQITRAEPKRSAIMPANGWPKPQSRFCSASANANTSRPQ